MNDQDIKKLQSTVEDLTRKVAVLEAGLRDPISRFMSAQSQKLLGQQTNIDVLEAAWSQYFYWFSSFEASEGWDVVSDAVLPVQSTGLNLQTTAVADDRSSAVKSLGSLADFDQESRFRTILYLGIDTTAADIDYSMSVGFSGIPGALAYYGFRVEEDELFGICADASSESKVKLIDLQPTQGNGIEAFFYIVEARFYPNVRVDYYVSNLNETRPILRASSSQFLPSGGGASINFDLYTRTTTSKAAFVEFSEYIQRRPQY